jgi:hypothetical protein
MRSQSPVSKYPGRLDPIADLKKSAPAISPGPFLRLAKQETGDQLIWLRSMLKRLLSALSNLARVSPANLSR